MPAFSLLTPLPGLPVYLLPLWPLIFWRIQRLKAWFRNTGGPGSQMLWGVDRWGRVHVISLSDNLSGRKEPGQDFRFKQSRMFREALGFENPASPSPWCPRRMPEPPAAQDPGMHRECGHQLLPRPET